MRTIRLLILSIVLGACTESPTGDPAAKEGAGGSAADELISVNLPSTESCGAQLCEGRSDCCTPADFCGREVAPEVFGATCIRDNERGGALGPECAESPEYCLMATCFSFPGCTLLKGGCGYWVDGYQLNKGDGFVLEVNLDLGCVPPEEMTTP